MAGKKQTASGSQPKRKPLRAKKRKSMGIASRKRKTKNKKLSSANNAATADDAPQSETLQRKTKKVKVLEFPPAETVADPQRRLLAERSLFHQGSLFHLGDVIRVISEDKETYYAQILRFWSDIYTEKYAEVQWLLPKDPSVKADSFIPSMYTVGPREHEPISMRCIIWVMQAHAFISSPYAPVFNSFGELAVLFNTNVPRNTATSIAGCKL